MNDGNDNGICVVAQRRENKRFSRIEKIISMEVTVVLHCGGGEQNRS